ncbi:hypothetical protein LCGC14_2520910, partial [marine sediment metagenome]
MKKILLITFLVIVLSSFVLGADTIGTQVFGNVFSADSNETRALLDWSPEGNNGTKLGSPILSNETWTFDANGEQINHTDFMPTGVDVDFAISVWIIPLDIVTGVTGKPIVNQIFGPRNGDFSLFYNNEDFKFGRFTGSSTNAEIFISSLTLIENTTQHWVVSYDASESELSFFLNGSAPDVQTGSVSGFNVGNEIGIGNTANANWFFKGEIYQYQVLNRTVNSSWVNDTFAEGRFFNPFDIQPPKPTVILISPTNNTITNNINQSMVCNVSWVDGYLTNLSLYINGTLNQTNTTQVINNTNYEFNVTFVEGDYYWNCLATDNNSNSSYADNNFTLHIHTGIPIIEQTG